MCNKNVNFLSNLIELKFEYAFPTGVSNKNSVLNKFIVDFIVCKLLLLFNK